MWSIMFVVLGAMRPTNGIIDGSKIRITDAQFMVAIMDCDPSGNRESCKYVCGGALVSRDAVVTSGKCLETVDVENQNFAPRVMIDRMFIIFGSDDLTESSKGKLAKAKKIVAKGYGRNIRFPEDDNLGIIFLDSCEDCELPPANYPIPIAVSTDHTECFSKVWFSGFGLTTTLPESIPIVKDWKLREGQKRLLSTETCRGAQWENEKFKTAHPSFQTSDIAEYRRYSHQVYVPDIFMCGHKGAAMCTYDDGSPVYVKTSIGHQLVGVWHGQNKECL